MAAVECADRGDGNVWKHVGYGIHSSKLHAASYLYQLWQVPRKDRERMSGVTPNECWNCGKEFCICLHNDPNLHPMNSKVTEARPSITELVQDLKVQAALQAHDAGNLGYINFITVIRDATLRLANIDKVRALVDGYNAPCITELLGDDIGGGCTCVACALRMINEWVSVPKSTGGVAMPPPEQMTEYEREFSIYGQGKP